MILIAALVAGRERVGYDSVAGPIKLRDAPNPRLHLSRNEQVVARVDQLRNSCPIFP